MTTHEYKSGVGCNEASTKNKEKKKSQGPPDKKDNNKREDDDSVFSNIAGPAPHLGLPHWEYYLNTVITDLTEGTKYSVREYVEGHVDENGHPRKKDK